MRIKREDNGRRAYWMAEAMSDTTNNLLSLTSALNACMLWHERRTEVRINSYLYFYSHPYGWWWCDEADNMLCKCCAEALFLRLQIFVMQNRQRLRIFYGDFTRVCIGRCERHGGREQRAESKVRKPFTMQHYDLPFKYWVRTIKLHPACITLCFNDYDEHDYEPHWTRTFDSIWMKIDILFTRIHAFTCIHSGDSLTSKPKCVSKHWRNWSEESFLWKTIKA